MSTLGEILVGLQFVTQDQLDYALQLQQSKRSLLGEIMVDLGFLTEDRLVEGLSAQLPAELKNGRRSSGMLATFAEEVQREVVSLAPARLLVQLRALPLRFDAERQELLVAMESPNDRGALQTLQRTLGYTVHPVPAGRGEMDSLFERHLGLSRGSGASQHTDLSARFRQIAVQAEGEVGATTMVDSLFHKALELGASDVHFDVFTDEIVVRMRVDGVLHRAMVIPEAAYPKVVSRLKVMGKLNISERRITQEGRATITMKGRTLDMRISVLPVYNGERIAVRLLDRDQSFDVNGLGVAENDFPRFMRQLDRNSGLVLVTGPTGSGKTTTLYSMLHFLNDGSRNIVTIEDPVEFALSGIGQVQVEERNGFGFASALRSVLRQDPNVIMVGEIRDEETARICVRASLTGHLVLATAHTNDAPSAIARLVNMGVPPYLIASCLNMAIAQRLVRSICPKCREQEDVDPRDLLRLGLQPRQIPQCTFYVGRGCNACGHTGYRGRQAIFEMMIMTPKLRELVGEQATVAELRAQARRENLSLLAMDGLRKAHQGLTSVEEVMRHTYLDPSG